MDAWLDVFLISFYKRPNRFRYVRHRGVRRKDRGQLKDVNATQCPLSGLTRAEAQPLYRDFVGLRHNIRPVCTPARLKAGEHEDEAGTVSAN